MTAAVSVPHVDLLDSRYRAPVVLLSSADHPSAEGDSAVGGDSVVLAVVVTSVDGAATVAERGRQACARVGVDVDQLIENESFRGDAGGLLVIPLSRVERPWRLLLVGVGAGEVADWRSAGAVLARRAGAKGRPFVVADPDADRARAFVEGFGLASYRLADAVAGGRSDEEASAADSVVTDSVVTDSVAADSVAAEAAAAEGLVAEPAANEPVAEPPGGRPAPDPSSEGESSDLRSHRVLVLSLERVDDPAVADGVRQARVVADAVCLARDLINMPSLVKTPRWFAEQARLVAADAGLGFTVLDHEDLVSQGFGGLVAVGGGSPRPPCLVQLTYEGPPAPAGATPPGHRVLVGKGITFDSGGLSLKPSVSMASMKTDMSGAAAVLGAMAALSELAVPGKVTALLCLAENLIGASSVRPGDVITCWGGTTVEVLNTDAEGRLVLADGLAYAAATLEPDQMVDLATLTGAITVALGRRTAGLFASDDTLARELATASTTAGERLWRLPLIEEYRPAINSPVADLANIGRALDVHGGSITAALFLREFTAGVAWAHLDIAGTARADGDDGEISRGGTGWGVRTLLAYLAGAR